MMVQHSGQVSALEVSASAIVPTLSPAGSLGFDDFTNLTPLVKEELRFAIQNKRQSHRMSSALDTVTVSERPVETSVMKTEVWLSKSRFGVNNQFSNNVSPPLIISAPDNPLHCT